MKRTVVPIIVFCLLLPACMSTAPQPDRSPLERAELTYAETSVVYKATMESLQDLRRLGRDVFPDARWQRVEELQALVQRHTPKARALLNLWRATGKKPSNYDETLVVIADAAAHLATIYAEVAARAPKKDTFFAAPIMFRLLEVFHAG